MMRSAENVIVEQIYSIHYPAKHWKPLCMGQLHNITVIDIKIPLGRNGLLHFNPYLALHCVKLGEGDFQKTFYMFAGQPMKPLPSQLFFDWNISVFHRVR